MTDPAGDTLDNLQVRQVIADIDRKRANVERKRQEPRLAPWAMALCGAIAGAALFAAGAAFIKLLG